MPYVALDVFRLYYDRLGDSDGSPPVIFLHGFTLDRRQWEPEALLSRGERKLLFVDARGHGLSDAPETGYSRADRVDDLLRFVDALEIERFHLVGLSMGGSTGIGFALEHQDRLVSLTLVSTGAAGWNIGKKISRIDRLAREQGLEAARAKWLQFSLMYFKDDQAQIRDRMATMIGDHSGAPWMDPRRGNYPDPGNDLERVHTITVPTLILVGEKDKIFVPLAHELAARIPDSRVKVYDNVGHMLNLEAPERFEHDLAAFLDEVDPRQ